MVYVVHGMQTAGCNDSGDIYQDHHKKIAQVKVFFVFKKID